MNEFGFSITREFVKTPPERRSYDRFERVVVNEMQAQCWKWPIRDKHRASLADHYHCNGD